jgi:RNA-directed DNA polymerase
MSNWTPRLFESKGAETGVARDYLLPLIAEGQRLRDLGVPVVFTLGHLAAICDVPYSYLRDIVSRRFDPYRIFNIKKRTGGFRQIAVPQPHLMIVQRWLHQNILLNAKTHSASTAYGHDCSPATNAREHCSSRWLVKVDVRQFFESISERQVYYAFRRLGYPALLSFECTRLCTRFPWGSSKARDPRWRRNAKEYAIQAYRTTFVGHLPQGAPTSPMLANIVCQRLDEQLSGLARRYECQFTRYADDIVFSGNNLDRPEARSLVRQISRLLSTFGFMANERKTHIVPPGAKKIVTGLLVDNAEPHLTKEFRARILLHLYHAKARGLEQHCRRRKFRSLLGFRNHLNGLITYAEHIDPDFGAKCRADFESLAWGVLSE